jgi:dTDP-glucose 4,6-dehydratase
MDGSKLAELGWRSSIEFDDGLAQTVRWFTENEQWWRALRSSDWDDYYVRQYGSRLAASTPA